MTAGLSSSARERKVLAAVADGIVSAAIGKGLQVSVTCSASRLTFAGQLTRALHARGRACRCLAPTPSVPTPGDPTATRHSTDAFVMIVDGAEATNDSEVYRISIRTTEDSEPGAPSRASIGDGRHDGDADLVVDYSDPDGPTVRTLSPRLVV